MVWKIFFDDGIKVLLKEGKIESPRDSHPDDITFLYIINKSNGKLEAIPKSKIARMEEVR